MENYEQAIHKELFYWKHSILQKPSLFTRSSKQLQTKINSLVPDKVHTALTDAIKKMVEVVLSGSGFAGTSPLQQLTLQERDERALAKIASYKRAGMLGGAGTGAGGVVLGLTDFPLLLSIKMRMLFELSAIYGFNTKQENERYFLLYIFQLAFSSHAHRQQVLNIIEEWHMTESEAKLLDWRAFQQEYRDYIDLAKLLQLMPGIGAVVGAVANYSLVEHLGKTTMNCFRLRLLQDITNGGKETV
ncbi:EcsC family protein [Bacillus sp. HMF5848]|uniref:EcsC family protein n=1 Tax=Bacillus sp. HMF5848 TaxID=2495421 RepID=UPI000F788250|nr:EcsC family protein [Bacillus sp. HMF5848]RSK26329.1 EcsC family protein [Bacillus sp. HMF5848]